MQLLGSFKLSSERCDTCIHIYIDCIDFSMKSQHIVIKQTVKRQWVFLSINEAQKASSRMRGILRWAPPFSFPCNYIRGIFQSSARKPRELEIVHEYPLLHLHCISKQLKKIEAMCGKEDKVI